jgi:hypothetical protein
MLNETGFHRDPRHLQNRKRTERNRPEKKVLENYFRTDG